jgi:hypothetical protein
MRVLVEDVGRSWCAGRLGTWMRLGGPDSGTEAVGGRPVRWAFVGGAVSVTHAEAAGEPLTYSVAIATTSAPNGGERLWWSCPSCSRRCGLLYLPAGRDRLGCRRCCGLGYATQYPRVRRGRRESGPSFTLTVTVQEGRGGRLATTMRRVKVFGAPG